jgi:hypothetical protein
MAATDPQQLRLEVERIEPPPAEPRSAPRKPVDHHAGRARSDSARSSAAALLLETPEALLTRSHLRDLGLERRAVDAVFRALPVVALPGYSRPMIRARDYVALLDDHTFRGDRIRPVAGANGSGRELSPRRG